MNKERLTDLLFFYLHNLIDQDDFEELLCYVRDSAYTDVFNEAMQDTWKRNKLIELLSEREKEVIFSRILMDSRFENSLRSSLPAEVKALPTQQRKVGFWRISAAAAILILMSAGILFFYSSNKNSAAFRQASGTQDVPPGGNNATLTLRNGKTITLSTSKSGLVINSSDYMYSDGTSLTPLVGENTGDKSADDVILTTPRGGKYEVVLPDGSKVWLNAASSLKFSTSFKSQKYRAVFLTGEAYFEITKVKGMPFIVKTDNQEVEVLGTHFNINSYQDEESTKTTLLEGSIAVSPSQGSVATKPTNQRSPLQLKPGQQSTLTIGQPIKLTIVDAETAIAWKKGDFILKDENFKATMRKIARWYDVEIVYDPSAPEDLELGGWVSSSKNLSAVLKVMELTGKVHFKIEGRRVTVTS